MNHICELTRLVVDPLNAQVPDDAHLYATGRRKYVRVEKSRR